MFLFTLLLLFSRIDNSINLNSTLFPKNDSSAGRAIFACISQLLHTTEAYNTTVYEIFNSTLTPRRSSHIQSDVPKVITKSTIYESFDNFDIIIMTENFHTLEILFREINIKAIDAKSNLIICLVEVYENINDMKSAGKNVSQILWENYKVNVIILTLINNRIFISTYYPFSKNCKPGPLVIENEWFNNTFLYPNKFFFPQKMKNLHGCTVRSASVVTRAVVSVDVNKKQFANKVTVATKVGWKLIKTVAKHLNVKLYFEEPPKTWEEIQHKISRDLFIISVSSFVPTPDKLEGLESLPGFFEDSFSFAYFDTHSTKYYWKSLYLPFSKQLWLLTIGILISVSLLPLILKGVGLESFKVHNAMTTCLGFTNPQPPKTSFLRFLFIEWTMYSYFITNCYNTGLIGSLIAPQETPKIGTFRELLDSGQPFGGSARHREFYNSPEDPLMMELYNKFQVFNNRQIVEDLFFQSKVATGMVQSAVTLHNTEISDDHKNVVRMLKDKLFTFNIPIIVSKGTPYVSPIYTSMFKLLEAGIIKHWIEDSQRLVKLEMRERGVEVDDDSSFTVLTIKHYEGPFYLYMLSIGLSVIVFLSEHLYYRHFEKTKLIKKKKPNFESSKLKRLV